MTDRTIPEPTADQCIGHAQVYEDDQYVGYAIWYPQMGGYVGKAVALFRKSTPPDACFDVYLWHDGEFPFGDAEPIVLHHCDPAQFVTFGRQIIALMESSDARGDAMRTILTYPCPCGEDFYEDDEVCVNCGAAIDRTKLKAEPVSEIISETYGPQNGGEDA